MKKHKILLSLTVLLACSSLGDSAPVSGPNFFRPTFKAGSEETPSYLEDSAVFKGGQRASVLAFAPHISKGEGSDALAPRLSIAVYEVKTQRLVAFDKSGAELVGVVWYPPRDGEYLVRVFNATSVDIEGYVSFK